MFVAGLACSVAASPVLIAQQPPSPSATQPSFEVVSVKPNKSGSNAVRIENQPGRFIASNVRVRDLIRLAYQVQDFQIVGAPSWVDADRFDINATVPDGTPIAGGPDGTVGPMMRALLADRFKLTTHDDTRDMPVYDLVKARADGRLGDKLRPSDAPCAAPGGPGARRGAPPPPGAGQRLQCGMMRGPGSLIASGTTLAQFVATLAGLTGRVVIDKTGLTGSYDFDLRFMPELPQGAANAPAPPPGAPAGAPVPPPIDPNAPTLFTAIQEQLGLKLDPSRGPVAVVVVDRVEQPTPD
jgi:uncharacterized protein (TIGR03435 family)